MKNLRGLWMGLKKNLTKLTLSIPMIIFMNFGLAGGNPYGDGYHQDTNPYGDGYIQGDNAYGDGYFSFIFGL